MPYIKNKRRKALQEDSVPRDVGELTYIICKVVDDYLRDKGKDEGLRYQYLAEVAGALANSQMEVYRRVSTLYENLKLAESSEVFHSQKLIKREFIPNE